jgi:hypothetical protein
VTDILDRVRLFKTPGEQLYYGIEAAELLMYHPSHGVTVSGQSQIEDSVSTLQHPSQMQPRLFLSVALYAPNMYSFLVSLQIGQLNEVRGDPAPSNSGNAGSTFGMNHAGKYLGFATPAAGHRIYKATVRLFALIPTV